jgi:hypothetical protein
MERRAVTASFDPKYVVRLFLAEPAGEGDARAAAILELLAGDGPESRTACAFHPLGDRNIP